MKVCVIGTGPSGLTTIKQLMDEGHDVTCFEKNGDLGGIWHRHDGDDDQMKVYDNLVLTISMKLMGFSDFMVEGDRVFYTQAQYLQYLRAYAEKFGLRERISFNSAVDEVRKTADGSYSVAVISGGKRVEHHFEAVAVCTGPFQTPNFNVTDIDKFTGEVVHSSRYRNSERFRDKRVLVVGLAESGGDLLREVADVASQCTLGIRSRATLIPRVPDGFTSTDALETRAHHWESFVRSQKLPFTMGSIFGDGKVTRAVFRAVVVAYGLASVACGVVANLFRSKTDDPDAKNPMGEPLYPLKMDLGMEWTWAHVNAVNEWNKRSHDYESNWAPANIFCKNVTFVPHLVSGKIAVNDSGIARMDGKTVSFKDGTSRDFDAVVLCTGFAKNFSVFGADIGVEEDNPRNLYRHSFHPDHGGRLAFMGFIRPFTGGIPVCAEMQARYFALLCSGKLRLPADVRERIRTEKEWEEYRTRLSPRHTESHPTNAFFLDALAKEIGCLVPMSTLIAHPSLLIRHWFYPLNQACYRIVGPHSMRESAMKELMTDKRGSLSSNLMIFLFCGLSVLPRFVHPKYVEMPYPPKSKRRSASARAARQALPQRP